MLIAQSLFLLFLQQSYVQNCQAFQTELLHIFLILFLILMTEQLLHIDVILVSFWSELQLERVQPQVLGLASLLCANVRFVCDIIIGSVGEQILLVHS